MKIRIKTTTSTVCVEADHMLDVLIDKDGIRVLSTFEADPDLEYSGAGEFELAPIQGLDNLLESSKKKRSKH